MRAFPIILLLLVAACAQVPMAPPMLDATAKEFAAEPDLANVYLVRDGIFGGAIAMPVRVNGEFAGETGPETYFLWQLPAGTYRVTSHGENVAEIEVTVEPGRNYFIRQTITMGPFTPRTELSLLDDRVGRKAVMDSERATSLLGEAS